jgi:hypothetical protein
MQLRQMGPNRTLVTLANGTEIFFSYQTPVAGRRNGKYFRTEHHYSVTTSKHIGQYLRDGNFYAIAEPVPQSQIEQWLEERP